MTSSSSGGEGAAGDESAAPDTPAELPPPDCLDLARSMARSVAAGPAKKAVKRRRPSVEGTRVSSAHPDDRDPQLLAGTVERLVGDHGWELSLRVHGVMARWGEIVGDDIAAHSTPESFADGRLVARTDSTAWATQLKLLVPTLLTRLNAELGQGTVTVLEVLGPRAPSWRKGPRTTRGGRGPRDTYG